MSLTVFDFFFALIALRATILLLFCNIESRMSDFHIILLGEETPWTAKELCKMYSRKDLRIECGMRGLPSCGTKAQLSERLAPVFHEKPTYGWRA